MRATASSTACSGLMSSAATRWIASAQIRHSCIRSVIVRQRSGHDLHRRGHAVRVAWIQPERLVDQLAWRVPSSSPVSKTTARCRKPERTSVWRSTAFGQSIMAAFR